MKNMKQIIIAALLTSAVSTPAIAAKLIPATTAPAVTATPAAPVRPVIAAPSPATPQTPAPAAQVRAAPAASKNSAFYAGAQVGDSTVGALLGYQISRMYSMEISYDYVDPIYAPHTTLETSRIAASGLAMFPVKFSEMGAMAIYIKIGYARTTDKSTVTDPGLGIPGFPATTTVTTTIKTGVVAGAGAQVDLSNSTSARLGVNFVGSDRSVYLAALYKF